MTARRKSPASDMDRYLYQFRLIIIGESTVGKSCLLRRFTDSRFVEHNDPTVGVDFHTKLVQIDGHHLKLQLWDTAGQERFRAITRSYFRNAVGALLVFDISDRQTFAKLPEWMDDVLQSAKPHTPVFILIGNKSDLDRQRQVQYKEAQQFANHHKMDYCETSARSGEKVEEAFTLLGRRIYEAIQDGSVQVGNGWDGVKKGDELPRELSRVNLGTSNRKMSDTTTNNGGNGCGC